MFQKLQRWLQERVDRVPSSAALGTAIVYALGAWPRFIRYLERPVLTPDNKACERAIQCFVAGRRNRLP